MSRKLKFIEKLSEEQKSSLQKEYTFGKSPLFRRRCHCILLSHSGQTIAQLSILFGVGEQSVRKWLKLWEAGGLKDLDLKPGRGRKPKLKLDNASHVKKVKTLIENEPQNLNQVKTELADQLGIDLSKRTLQRFLKNLNTVGSDFGED